MLEHGSIKRPEGNGGIECDELTSTRSPPGSADSSSSGMAWTSKGISAAAESSAAAEKSEKKSEQKVNKR